MTSNFESATGGQKYFAAFIAAFRHCFHRRSKPDNTKDTLVSPIAEYPTSLHCQNLYQDQSDYDPPTPHWGC
jgi:hypothetical protein